MLRFTCLHLLLFASLIVNAQPSQKDQGLITYKLGTDTIYIQHFEYDQHKFHTTILILTGQIEKWEGVGELDATGDIKEIQSKLFLLDGTGNWTLATEGHNIFNGDSSIYIATSKGKQTARRVVAGKAIISNVADPCSFFMFPFMGFFAPAKNGDTLFHCQFAFNECRAYQVARIDKNTLKIGSSVMGRFKLFTDNNGKMTGADATGSSLNFIASVDRNNANDNQYIDAFAKRRFNNGSFTPRIIRDTARVLAQGKKIEVDYWRPLRRGRVIFGTVQPWGRIWRTGANNATQLRTAADLSFNGNALAAGSYSLWTLPTETSWTLIINKKANIWGTEYDATADILKVPMNFTKTTTPVDVFTISLLPQQNKTVRLQIEWEYYKAWADFDVQ